MLIERRQKMPKPKLATKVLDALQASPDLKNQIKDQFLELGYWIREENWNSALTVMNELSTTIKEVNAIKQEKFKEIGFSLGK